MAFLGILGAIGWLLIAKKPIVNLTVCKVRIFFMGCMLIAAASAIHGSSQFPRVAQKKGSGPGGAS